MLRLSRLIAAGSLLLAGCTVGPDYVRPSAEVTSAYKEHPVSDVASDKNVGAWAPAYPSDDAIRSNWWEVFGDAELNLLEEQVGVANQDLKAAEARFRAARALVGFARADEFPTVGIGTGVASLKDSANEPYFPNKTDESTGDFALTADLSYEVDLWGRIRRQVTAATEKAQASAADLETAKLSLQAELALNYFNLRNADAQQRLLDDTVKSYQDSLQLAQDRLEGGAAPASDVAQAKSQLDTARVQDTDIAVERALYEHAIAVLIGKPPAEFSLAPSPIVLKPPQIPIGLPSELLQRRPDVAAAERRAGVANEQIGIAISAYYPSVSLSGLTGYEGTSAANWFDWPSFLWSIGTSLSETVFDGGRRSAKSAAARAEYDAAIADYRQTTLTAFRQVEDNLATLRVLNSEEAQQNEAVESAKTNLQVFTDRYVGGRDSFLQVTTAQTNYLENERNQVEIQHRYMVASVLLIKALGGGWDADTGLALSRAAQGVAAGTREAAADLTDKQQP
jgi:NodT family efflux transporter outer membrane factor (OMF) lipoprotein